MPVLLSHTRNDEQEAQRISHYLMENGVINHVELFDQEQQTTDEITAKLMERVQLCTHLMPVISEYTEASWWVPFEIGAGAQFDKRIASYQPTSAQMPAFLQKWPILKNHRDLDCFIRCYKQDTSVALSASHGDTKRISSVDQFHRELKAAIKEGANGGKGGKKVLRIRP